MANRIKFGTDGWRAIIADEYTIDNVARLTYAVAEWLGRRQQDPQVVIGYDTRFGGKLFAQTAAKVFALKNVKVIISDDFVTTPMVSLAVKTTQSDLGIVITASHNPPSYNGYKLKGDHGGPLLDKEIHEIENLVPDENPVNFRILDYEDLVQKGKLSEINLDDIYFERVNKSFDLEELQNSKFNFAFDAMFGSGQKIIKRILPNINALHCDLNPSFNGISPEPLHRNLEEFSDFIRNEKNIDCGLAVDGDADRIALYDSNGNYIDSHHILLLLIYYLAKHKKMSGKVVTGFSSTVKIETLAKHFNLDVERVFIGFKHACKVILSEDVLVGGEESGGISVKGHIPERDGIWMGLMIFQFMNETGKSLEELIAEVYDITGEFSFERRDLRISQELKNKIVNKCKNNPWEKFGKYKVERLIEFDGFKFFFNEYEWLMIRPSGTEPVLRFYAESKNKNSVADILNKAIEIVLNNE